MRFLKKFWYHYRYGINWLIVFIIGVVCNLCVFLDGDILLRFITINSGLILLTILVAIQSMYNEHFRKKRENI
jgi:hypothetical protein